MKIKELKQSLLARANQTPTEQEIDELMGSVLNMSWGELRLKSQDQVTSLQLDKIEDAMTRLMLGEPLAYILGEKFFYKHNFLIEPGVLIPRPETELLVEAGLGQLSRGAKVQVVDIGSGSGCVGLSIAAQNSDASVYLFDANQDAVRVTTRNIQALGLKNAQIFLREITDRADGDWPWSGSLDLVVANPPYIERGDDRVHWRVHQYEPHQALYADRNGLDWIHKWMIWSYHQLRVGGAFIFEFGRDQEQDILALVPREMFQPPDLIHDYSGHARFMVLIKEG